MNNNLYLITRPAHIVGYDEAAGFVVAASSHKEARALIVRKDEYDRYKHIGDEGPDVWKSSSGSRCELLATNVRHRRGIVLKDFNNG